MSSTEKSVVLEEFAVIARALGHVHRLEILEHLAQGERSVEGLAERVGLSIANTSQHLQHLRRVGLAASRREGKYVLYRLADDSVVTALSAIRRVSERNVARVERILSGAFDAGNAMEAIPRDELLARMQDGRVTLLDVRPPDEYSAGHLPAAVNIPLAELEARIDELDPNHEIVAYCRGPYCVLSSEAVAALRERGFTVRRLADGLPEWRAEGLPVETSG